MSARMRKLEAIVARLPETARVDVEAWDGEPTFRVRGKTFVFTAPEVGAVTLKLPKEEAVALCATDPRAEPAGYGLGRHGWVRVELGPAPDWVLVEEWVRTSYTQVAPKTLARVVLAEDAAGQ
jgi:predicted DNA-binding protein (MmcQ/YjbR family)